MVTVGKRNSIDDIRDAIVRMAAMCGTKLDLTNIEPMGRVEFAKKCLSPSYHEQREPETYEQYRGRLTQYLRGHECCAGYDSAIIDWMSSMHENRDGALGLFLYGASGSGKTRRMDTISKWFGIDVLDAREMVVKLKELKNDAARLDYIRIPSYGNATPRMYDLIIDDLGCEIDKSNPFGENYQAMEFVIRERHKRFPQNKTIISSNLSPDAIVEYYGDKNAGRIMEMCVFVNSGNINYRSLRTLY